MITATRMSSPPNLSAVGATADGPSTSTGIISSASLANIIPRTVSEKAKKIEQEARMEYLRSKKGQERSFPEIARSAKSSKVERRYSEHILMMRNSRDILAKYIKVKTPADLIDRLENISHQAGMRFVKDHEKKNLYYISSDTFFLEVMLDDHDRLIDVRIRHECAIAYSCKELVDCLNNSDFDNFFTHLEGLLAIYQVNADANTKNNAFLVLQAMETDIMKFYQMQTFNSNEILQQVAESAVGIVLPRIGGHAMRLTYFVSPYDFINLETQEYGNVSIDGINSKKLGLSVEVRLEASSAYKLPLTSTISFAKDPVTGIETGLPIYATLTQQNSMLFPAIYVLRLNKPLPVCCNTLQNLLGSSSTISQHLDTTSATNLLNLIVESTPDEKRGILQRQFFVNLPDSTHCYFFTQRNTSPKGTVLTSVPFTEAAQVPKIIEFLKKHALFYTLISSCVRPQSKMIHDMDTTTVVEVDGYSVEKIVVTVQHPYDESLATLEFELSNEPGSIDCKIFSLYTDYTEIAQKMKKFIKKSLSIPCTVRALLRIWEKQRMEMFQRGIGPTSGTGGGGSLIEATYGSSLASNMSLASDLFTVQSSSSSNITMARQMGLGGSANETCASSSNVSGYLQFKQENMMPTMRNEDFTDSSQLATAASAQTLTGILSSTIASITTSSSTNSLQPSSLISLEKIPQMMHTTELSKFNEIEIADKYKNIWKDKTPNLKSGQFSITPIETTDASMSAAATTSSMSQATQLDVKRSGGIEIIPLTSPLTNPQLPMQSHQSTPTLSTNETSIASTSAGNLQSTITITPINTINTASSSTSKDRTAAIICSSTSHTSLTSAPSITAVAMSSTALPTTLKRVAASDTDTILSISSNSSTSSSSSLTTATANATAAPPKEKKRKKKRDDSPMGPPDKVYSRQNSPSSSPKGAGSMSSTGALIGSVPAGIVGGPSPKHSPVYSSPKHTNTASNSPKSPFGTHSPKHGSSGKPSMSTLKSASSVSASNVGTAAAVTSAAVVGMKSREKEKSTSISTSASSLSGMAMATTATTVGGLIAPLSMPKSSHLGLSGMAAVNSLSHQLKNVASLNQYLSGYGSGGSSPSALSSSMSSAADMTTAVLGLRKSQSIPPPPPLPVNLTASGSSIGVSGAGAAVSSMMQMLQHLQQGPQLPLPHGSSERLIPSIIVSGSTAEAATATLSTDSTTSSSSVETLSSTSPSSSTEYRVRPSPEGLKLTINKTSISSSVSKSASLHTTTMSSLSSSLTSTSTMTEKTPTPSTAATATTTTTPPRSHTGLKPGVISGPASKIGRLSPGSSTSSVSSSPQSASPKSTTTSPTLASTISPTTSAAYSRTFPISKPVMRLMQYAASTTPLSYSQLLPPPPPTPETPTTTNMSSIEAFLSSHGLATNISFSQLTQRTSTMTSEALSMSAVRSTEFNTCKSVRSTSTSFLSPTPAQLFEQMHRSSAIQGFTLPTASTYGEIPLPSPTTVTFETPTSTISDSPVQQIEQHFSTSENIASSSSSAISSTTSRSKTGNNGNGKNRNK